MLYPGAGLSQEMGMMLIMSLASKHKLTYSALADILKVICLHLPADSIPASYKSVYRLFKNVKHWVSIQVITWHTNYVESVGHTCQASKSVVNPPVKHWI